VQPDRRVLVVGTTPDYIQWIRQSCSGETLFLTEPQLRQRAVEPAPRPDEELLCDLRDHAGVRTALLAHLDAYHQEPVGVACFDCESMELAAVLAGHFGLPYPSVAAVANCRNKYLSKCLWRTAGLETPPAMLVRSAADAVRFQQTLAGPIVLKPLSGSGSELIFIGTDPQSCRRGYQAICSGLRQRCHQRLYADFCPDEPRILAEGMICGAEYSCDFSVRDGRALVIRLTRKIPAGRGPFGTIQGYVLTSAEAEGLDAAQLDRTLVQSAAALGIERAVCMLDFIIHQGVMVLLELAPRPGGDCLPFLLRQAYDLDMLKLQLDFARQKPLHLKGAGNGRPLVGLRVHARKSGILKQIDCAGLREDPRIRNIHLIREQGHRIVLPPEDYDTWILGHVIFEPDPAAAVEPQCRDLLEKIGVIVA
jgi:biotin carboxylase